MDSGRRKLLLADDSPTIRKVVSLTFEDEGYEVVAVADGTQALGALEEGRPPDVLLADVWMPGPDGYELCERVKRDPRLRGVAVVLLVGTFETFNEAEARRVGADTFVTKPFQSIRDLVSKVGSLFGGGGSSAGPKDEAAREERAPEVAPADVSPPPAAEDTGARAHSFADFADDELIEAKPAESFKAAPPAPEPWAGEGRRRTDMPAAGIFGATAPDAFDATASDSSASEGAHKVVEWQDPDFDTDFTSNGDASHEAHGFGARAAETLTLDEDESEDESATVQTAAAPTADVLTDLTEDDFTAPTRESVMHEQTPPQTSHDANATTATNVMDATNAASTATATNAASTTTAASAAASDDALLDLGQDEVAAAAPAADDDDDFILDLGFDDEEPLTAAAPATASAPEPFSVPEPVVAAARPDAPSAFAEAAHGEPQPSFAGAASSSSSFAQAERTSSATTATASSAKATTDDAPWRDVVVQDGPRGFVFGAEDEQESEGGAPRGSVEPEVVPAAEPVPATVEGEFTDGSVEGDQPKPPAGQSASAPNVGQARVGVEEPLRADQLSKEAIDAIARRVVELMSDKVVREIAWEVVPELAELLIKQKLEEEKSSRQ
ncbi:MAG TPA: response regulator [Pyrinomonadaceae bacterium]|nr:response regulator [Pyrinomonadaceae bacterium]